MPGDKWIRHPLQPLGAVIGYHVSYDPSNNRVDVDPPLERPLLTSIEARGLAALLNAAAEICERTRQ